MRKILGIISAALFAFVICSFIFPMTAGPPVHTVAPDGTPYSKLPVWSLEYQTTYTDSYDSSTWFARLFDDTEGLHSPIPMECRVKNHTGIQCVYSSIEMLGRWAEEPKLMNPPITSRSDCKGYSGPSAAASRLEKIGVKFKQTYQDKTKGRKFFEKYVQEEGRGVLFDIPGHAMVMVHYDPENDDIRFVDNSDRSLRVQKWTKAKFESRWGGWVLVLFADNDVIPYKVGMMAQKIPIHDRNNPSLQFNDKYIPMPARKEN